LQNLRIWDKKTASTKEKLHHFKQFNAPLEENFKSQTAFKSRDKRLLETAMEIIKA